MGKVIESGLPCIDQENCGSSDALSTYIDNKGKYSATCFSCNKDFQSISSGPNGLETSHYNGNTKGGKLQENQAVLPLPSSSPSSSNGDSLKEILDHPIREIKARGINYSTAEKYGVRVGVDTRDGVTPTYYLFPAHKDGELSGAIKKVVSPKTYQCIQDCKGLDLFGLHCIPKKAKKLFITEGYEDALSLYQILKEGSSFDWEPAVVSLPNGTSSAVPSITRNLESLSDYDQIVLVFDQDEPGKRAAKEVCKALAGKIYTASFPLKDANEMLLAGRGEELKWAVLTGARKYQPDGIINAKDCWDRYKESKNVECYPYPDTLPELNSMTYGVRPGSIVTITAGTSIGKTQFMRELKYHYYQTTNLKIADIALEEDVGDTLAGLISLELNKRITLPDIEVSDEEERKAFKALFATGRFTLYDYFGGMDDDSLFSKLRYFAATGHKLIFLDHLSIIVSEYASDGGERERIDTIMTKLAKFVKETGVVVFLVVHLKKSSSFGTTFEEGAAPTLDDLRGSATIKQLSWDVLALSRNLQHPDKQCASITEINVLKCRFTGRTGLADHLRFDERSGRMLHTDVPPNYKN